jgi:hypothetical protein
LLPKIEQALGARSADRFQGGLIAKSKAIHLSIGIENDRHIEVSQIVKATG